MGEDSRLYELVWGEPVPAPANAGATPPPQPKPPPRTIEADGHAGPPEPEASQDELLARLEAIEGSMAGILEAVQHLGYSPMSQDMVLISLETLESRMGRLEKGLVRSLEHLESIITESRSR